MSNDEVVEVLKLPAEERLRLVELGSLFNTFTVESNPTCASAVGSLAL
jgi:hypothetical protein